MAVQDDMDRPAAGFFFCYGSASLFQYSSAVHSLL